MSKLKQNSILKKYTYSYFLQLLPTDLNYLFNALAIRSFILAAHQQSEIIKNIRTHFKKELYNMKIGEILIYQNQEGNIKIDVRLEEETVWLTQDQMAQLFGKAKSTINEHLKNIMKKENFRKACLCTNSEFPKFSKKRLIFTILMS